MIIEKVILLISALGWTVVMWRLRAVLHRRDPGMTRMYVWTAVGFGLTTLSYLLRVMYSRHGVVNIPAFLFSIGETLALFAAIVQGSRQQRERRDKLRRQ